MIWELFPESYSGKYYFAPSDSTEGATRTLYDGCGGGIYVAGGTLNMYAGFIMGNIAMCGGGVYVGRDLSYNPTTSNDYAGTFNMYGGEILNNEVRVLNSSGSDTMPPSYNRSPGGGGVYVTDGSTFNMYAGIIRSNIAGSSGSTSYHGVNSGYNGGGVFVTADRSIKASTVKLPSGAYASQHYGQEGLTNFFMYGGQIYNNNASSAGGICVDGGGHIAGNSVFFPHYPATLSNGYNQTSAAEVNIYKGTITSNAAANHGGGLKVYRGAYLALHNDSVVAANSVSRNYGLGGGVEVDTYGWFSLYDSTIINGNLAYIGGGVYVAADAGTNGNASFFGGEITGNQSYYNKGGGIYLGSGVTSYIQGLQCYNNTGSTGSISDQNNVYFDRATNTTPYFYSSVNGMLGYRGRAAYVGINNASGGFVFYKNQNTSVTSCSGYELQAFFADSDESRHVTAARSTTRTELTMDTTSSGNVIASWEYQTVGDSSWYSMTAGNGAHSWNGVMKMSWTYGARTAIVGIRAKLGTSYLTWQNGSIQNGLGSTTFAAAWYIYDKKANDNPITGIYQSGVYTFCVGAIGTDVACGVLQIVINPRYITPGWSSTSTYVGDFTYDGTAQKPRSTASVSSTYAGTTTSKQTLTPSATNNFRSVAATVQSSAYGNVGWYVVDLFGRQSSALVNGNAIYVPGPNNANVRYYTASGDLPNLYLLYKIKPRPIEVEWSDTTFTYDGKSHLPTPEVSNLVGNDSVTLSASGAKTSAGTYVATATFNGTFDNYTLTGGTGLSTNFTIKPKTLTDVKWIGPTSYYCFDEDCFINCDFGLETYGKDASNYVSATGVIEGQYPFIITNSIDVYEDTDKCVELIEDSDLFACLPGTYSIVVSSGANYNFAPDSGDTPVTRKTFEITVKPRPVHFEFNNSGAYPTVEYNGKANAPSPVLAAADDDYMTYSGMLMSDLWDNAYANGSYGFALEFTTAVNSADAINASDTPYTATVTGIRYSGLYDGDASWEFLHQNAPKAASCFVLADDLNDDELEFEYVITPRTIDIEWSNLTLTYNGQKQTPSFKVKNVIEGDDLNVAFTTASGAIRANTAANPHYLANLYIKESVDWGNYKIADKDKDKQFVINPLPIEVTWDTDTLIYNGKDQTPKPTISNLIGEDVVNLTITGAGKYAILDDSDIDHYTAVITAVDNTDYTVTGGEGLEKEFVIDRRVIEVLWDETTTFQYDGQTHFPNAIANNSIAGENVVLTIIGKQKNAGKHTASVSGFTANGDLAKNYVLPGIDPETGKDPLQCEYRITAVKLTVVWSHTDDLVYNGYMQHPTATLEGILEGDTCVVVDYEGKQINAGENYVASIASLSNTNYSVDDIENPDCVYLIKKKSVSVTWTQQNVKFTYDGTAHVPSATVNGVISNESRQDVVKAIVEAIGDDKISANNHTAKVVGLVNENDTPAINYELDNEYTTIFTILPKAVTPEWTYSEPIDYRGETITVTANVLGLVLGEGGAVPDVKFTYEDNSKINAGKYVAKITGLTGDDAGNYCVELPQTTPDEGQHDAQADEVDWEIDWEIRPINLTVNAYTVDRTASYNDGNPVTVTGWFAFYTGETSGSGSKINDLVGNDVGQSISSLFTVNSEMFRPEFFRSGTSIGKGKYPTDLTEFNEETGVDTRYVIRFETDLFISADFDVKEAFKDNPNYVITIRRDSSRLGKLSVTRLTGNVLRLAEDTAYDFITAAPEVDGEDVYLYHDTYTNLNLVHGVDDTDREQYPWIVLGRLTIETSVNAFLQNIDEAQRNQLELYDQDDNLIYSYGQPGEGVSAEELDDPYMYSVGTGWRVVYAEDVVYISLLGDLDSLTGSLTMDDANCVIDYLLYGAEVTEWYRIFAYDIDNSGYIDINDFQAICDILLGYATVEAFFDVKN